MPRPSPTLLFDFDGTVALGDGPMMAYATAVATELDELRSRAFLATVRAELTAAGTAGHGRPVEGVVPIDGYDLIRILAVAEGVEEQRLSTAYLASRHLLATDDAAVHSPLGLAGFLAEAKEHANLILATNAPDIRINEALASLGLDGSFHRIVTNVGKPAGLNALLDELLAASDSADGLLSIGDVWVNDLAPVSARGGLTALVGAAAAAAPHDATPTFLATSLSELYPDILAWLRGDTSSTGPTLAVSAAATPADG